jgi:hypothetical protein
LFLIFPSDEEKNPSKKAREQINDKFPPLNKIKTYFQRIEGNLDNTKIKKLTKLFFMKR